MEVEETTLPVVENPDENNTKKGKILNLLLPPEAVPAEGKEAKKDKNKPLTKVVIRRLPPRLTKESFIEEFAPLPAHDYFHFVRGDLSLGSHSFSRAYINFINQNDIYVFKEKYDDYGVQDEKGKTYHAVVEFAPFQRVPRRNALKKKLSKAGTLESDPKYVEFLKKLEEYKSNATNTSEYFHETESPSLKVKVTTTPLLEFLKLKKQKKNDLKNELRPRKRELEKERKRKEDEKRKAERERRKEEKKNSRYEDKNKILDDKSRKSEERLKENRKNEIRGRSKDDKKEVKNWKDIESDALLEDKSDVVIPTDPAILKVLIRQPEKTANDRNRKSNKVLSASNEENKSIKSTDSDSNLIKNERKYPEFRSRLTEDKQRKAFHKKDSEESKVVKTRSRKGVPDEKGDNYSIGNCSEYGKTPETEGSGKKQEQKEAKSKFRYSEQRNREREYRNQKVSDWKKDGVESKSKSKGKDGEDGNSERVGIAAGKDEDLAGSNELLNKLPVKTRRRSLEIEKKCVEEVRKRSRSFHDLGSKKSCDLRMERKDLEKEGCGADMDDGSKEGNDSERTDDDCKKDPRVERRIRNKDRPSMEIYRPGMGKFSKQRMEQKKDDTNGSGSNKNNRIVCKSNNKKSTGIKNDCGEPKSPIKTEESSSSSSSPIKTTNSTPTKTASEVRTMTFTRSGSKEN